MIDLLIIGGSFPMPMGGGSVNYVHNIIPGINDLNYVVLTANFKKEDNASYDSNFGHRIIRSKYIAHVLDSRMYVMPIRYTILLISILQTAYWIIKLRPRMVYYTNYTFLAASYYLVSSFINTKLGILTYAEEIQKRLNRPILKKLLGKLLRDSSIIFTVCDYTRQMMCDIVPGIENKIKIIIPPVNIPSMKTWIRKSDKEVTLLTVARLEERKGHKEVLAVLKELLAEGGNIRYKIIGSGSYEFAIKKDIEKLGLEKYVMMLGKVSDEELEHAYNEADIFVMPHKQLENGDTEGCPTVFLEASLHFLPVIGGDAGGVANAIIHERTGFICNSGSRDLYNYLKQLILSPQLRLKMGENGHNYAIQFSSDNQSKMFGEYTKSILGKSK